MNSYYRLSLLAFTTFAIIAVGCAQKSESSEGDRILIFYKTKGFYHESIPSGIAAIEKLGEENNFNVTAVDDADRFTFDKLKNYKAVVFLSTTGDVLDDAQQSEFQKYIQSGGGFVGIHAAADTEYDWPWYNKLVGAYFMSHPKPQQATVTVVDNNHVSTRHLPPAWVRTDEWYNYKSIVPGLNVLCRLDESTYEGGENGADHPIAWYRDFDGGRSFYTGGGHTDSAYKEPLFLEHLLGGLKYAMGVK